MGFELLTFHCSESGHVDHSNTISKGGGVVNQKILIMSIGSVSFFRLISNMHNSIAFDECFHLMLKFLYLQTQASFNIYDVTHLYDVIVLKNKCKILRIAVLSASSLLNFIHSDSIFIR